MPEPRPRTSPSLSLALFFCGALWLLAASIAAQRSAQGIATQLNLAVIQPFLRGSFLAMLLALGFTLLRWVSTRFGGIRSTNALPTRPTAKQEWTRGAALGWSMLLVAVLPLMLTGALYPHLSLAPAQWGSALIALATLAVLTLASELAFRGYLFRCLIDAAGPSAATIVMSFLFALSIRANPNATGLSVLVTFALGLLFSMAYLRTHAIWLSWGLHFAWTAAMGVLFGLPVAGLGLYSSVVTTDTAGRTWFSGGAYGPEASLITVAVALLAIPVLFRITREYAWNYTHEPIVAGGYPMEAQPPAAHVAMQNSITATQAPLVQILATTSSSPSTMAAVEEHLRSNEVNTTPTE